MYTRQELARLVGQYIASLELPTEPKRLYEPIAYSLEDGGKRLRPILVLLCSNLFDNDVHRAMPAAAAIEVFHNFTLLHDDIMDNAPVRRGKPAVHARWDTNTAILSGDAMMIYAYSLLSHIGMQQLPQVFAQFNKMAIEVCEGQQYDIDFESRSVVSIAQYIEMIRLKTSVLLAGAAKIGAIVGGACEADSNILYDFAVSLGLAFQIQDDLLDTYGDDKTLGKSVGGDIMEGKKTFLTITAMESASEQMRDRLLLLLHNKQMDKASKIVAVRAIYDSLSVADTARRKIEDYLAHAIGCLDNLSVDHSRTIYLRELAQSLSDRNK